MVARYDIDWFLLGLDFAVRTVSMETVQDVFLFWSNTGKFKICKQNSEKKKMWTLSFFIAKLPEKAKRLKFYWDFKDGWRRRTFSERVQYYHEHLETFDSETETGITESQEAIDDFINQHNSANTNKKKATDMNTLLRYIEANGRKNEKIESLPASELDHLLSKFVWTYGGKTEKNKSQRQFPVFSPV